MFVPRNDIESKVNSTYFCSKDGAFHWKSLFVNYFKAISIPYTNLKPIISKFLHKKWQQRWDMNINNKLFQIQPSLGEWRPAFRASKREQVIISRLRIGHTRLTHTFILKQEPQPQCLMCQTTCMVKHILIECRAFAVIRKRFFKVTSLTELFENIKIDDILFFLWETGLYEKIWRIKTD